jgi:hypothetical protein
MAQPPVTRQVTSPPRACDMSQRALTLRLVDAASRAPLRAGAATVAVLRKDTGAKLRDASEFALEAGSWIVVEDGELPLSAPGDTAVLVLEVQRAGRQMVRREITVELDARGCHVMWRGGVLAPVIEV